MSGTTPEAVLLDTCAVIWLANGSQMAGAALEAILRAGLSGGIFVSPISAWEVGLLARPGRTTPLHFVPDPKSWFQRFMAGPGIRAVPLTADIALDSAALPASLHADPADRLLIATARHFGMPIVTRDTRMLDYASAGHLRVIAC